MSRLLKSLCGTVLLGSQFAEPFLLTEEASCIALWATELLDLREARGCLAPVRLERTLPHITAAQEHVRRRPTRLPALELFLLTANIVAFESVGSDEHAFIAIDIQAFAHIFTGASGGRECA